jgi:hypothetical protein
MRQRRRLLSVPLTIAALVVGLTVATLSPALAGDGQSDPTGTITGRVVNENGQPVAGTSVSVSSFDTPAAPDATYYQSSTTTDSNGYYTVSSRAGYVVLSFTADGYETTLHDGSDYTFRASRLPLPDGGSLTQNMVLKRPTPTWNGPFMPARSSNTRGLGVQLSQGWGAWSTNSTSVPLSELHISYQWYRVRYVNRYTRLETPIPGATGPTYTTTAGDLSQQVALTMTATHPLLRTAVARTETDNPVMRQPTVTVLSYRSPKKKTKHVQAKIRVSAEALPHAAGSVRVGCKVDKRGNESRSRAIRLVKGRATVTFKPKGVTKRSKAAYCRVYYSGSSDTWSKVVLDLEQSRNGTRVKLRG